MFFFLKRGWSIRHGDLGQLQLRRLTVTKRLCSMPTSISSIECRNIDLSFIVLTRHIWTGKVAQQVLQCCLQQSWKATLGTAFLSSCHLYLTENLTHGSAMESFGAYSVTLTIQMHYFGRDVAQPRCHKYRSWVSTLYVITELILREGFGQMLRTLKSFANK